MNWSHPAANTIRRCRIATAALVWLLGALATAPATAVTPAGGDAARYAELSADPADSGNVADDAKFARAALVAGTQMVADARQAQRRARRLAVRRLAERLAREHSALNIKLARIRSLAERPQTPVVSVATLYAPSDSDRDYLLGQMRAQRELIELYTKELNAGRDPDLVALVGVALPRLRQQLRSLQRLLGATDAAVVRVR